MPDPVTVSVVVTLLALKFAEGAGAQLGADSTRALGGFVARVRARLRGDSEAEAAVAELEAHPADGAAAERATRALEERFAADEELRRMSEEFIASVRDRGDLQHILVQVGGNAQVGKIASFGEVHGDVTF
ncbi:hypothetical protein [Streptomyces adustus]|uniref:hypothetical protein n=1 Tax=Streptomyces adustus TaxID=1609272 RepID=UPI003722E463